MLSNIEFKLLLGLFCVVLFVGVIRIAEVSINLYNHSVAEAQLDQKRVAEGSPKIEFSGCNPCTSYPHQTIIPLQMILLPFAFWCLKLRGTCSFILSTSLLLLVFYGYIDWLKNTYKINVIREYFDFENTWMWNYLFYNASVFDFILFLGISVLTVVQTAVLIRYTMQITFGNEENV